MKRFETCIDFDQITISRTPHLADKVVFVDGLGGCGKTMFSTIISSFERVELLTYAYEIEHICSLCYLGKIKYDAAQTMVRMLTDLKLYNTMMSRETNFRPSDLSSVFKNVFTMKYILRLFRKGDEHIPERVYHENPILHLTTHYLTAISDPIFSALGERVVFIEIVRHPLYMIKQETLNMERNLSGVRHFTIHFRCKDKELPYWTRGWEDLFIRSNPAEKAVYTIDYMFRLSEKNKKTLKDKYNANIITIPFEKFVINPWPYIKTMEEALLTKMTASTYSVLKKQKVPRKMYADGISLKVYKKYAWEPPKTASEKEEFDLRRQFAAERTSAEAIGVLDQLCKDYEKEYLKGYEKG